MKLLTKKGFTLIELVISVSIILLFSGITLAFFNDFTEDKKLDAEADKLINTLELARSKAINSDASVACTSGSIKGYKVKITVSNYTLSIHCVDASGADLADTDIYTNNFSPSLGSTGNTVVEYVLTTATAVITGINPMRINNSSSGKCLYVNISAAPVGLVSRGTTCP